MAPHIGPCANRRGSLAEREAWFRILHLSFDDTKSSAHLEQGVEVALAPEGAFENGNIGHVMHVVLG